MRGLFGPHLGLSGASGGFLGASCGPLGGLLGAPSLPSPFAEHFGENIDNLVPLKCPNKKRLQFGGERSRCTSPSTLRLQPPKEGQNIHNSFFSRTEFFRILPRAPFFAKMTTPGVRTSSKFVFSNSEQEIFAIRLRAPPSRRSRICEPFPTPTERGGRTYSQFVRFPNRNLNNRAAPHRGRAARPSPLQQRLSEEGEHLGHSRFPKKEIFEVVRREPPSRPAASPSPFRPRHSKDCENLGNSALPQTRNLHNSAARAPLAADRNLARRATMFTIVLFPKKKFFPFGGSGPPRGRAPSTIALRPRARLEGEHLHNSSFS